MSSIAATTGRVRVRLTEGPRSLGVALAAVLSGVMLGCCFPPIDAQALAWVALAPLGFVVSARRLTVEAWCGVYLGGLAFHVIALRWLCEVENIPSSVSLLLILSQLGALLFCVSVLAIRRVARRRGLAGWAGVPLFWAVYASLRLALVTWLEPAAAPWLRLGSTQLEWTTVAQLAGVGGVFALSLFVALVNGWFYLVAEIFVSRGHKPWAVDRLGWMAAPVVVVAVLAYGSVRIGQYQTIVGPTIALLPRDAWLVDHDRRWESDAPDLLVWPEQADHHKLVSSHPHAADRAPDDVRALARVAEGDYGRWYRERLARAAELSGAAVLIGCERVDLTEDGPVRYNSVAFADPRRGYVGHSDKQSLVPVFERPTSPMLSGHARRGYAAGGDQPRFTLHTRSRDYRFACIVCYDIASRSHVVELAGGNKTDFLVHCGSEGMDHSGVASTVLLRLARLRAIETGRPIVRSCHAGASGVIDAVGRFTPCAQGTLVRAPVQVNPPQRTAAVSLCLLGCLLMAGICVQGRGASRFLRAASTACDRVRFSEHESMEQARGLRHTGFTLLEMLAVVAILGTVALIVVPRIADYSDAAKERTDEHNRAQINAAVERYYLVEGSWPANNLSDIGADLDYFPEGVPKNPVDGSDYQLNSTTHRVEESGSGGGIGWKWS